MKDEELIKMLIEGKEGAAEALMNQYGAMIHYIINPIVVNTQDREECYSDVILRVLDKVEQFTGSPARFKGWLTTLTRNVAINKVRGKRIEQESEEMLKNIPSKGPTPEESLLKIELQKEVNHILNNSLRRQEQELVYRRFFYEQSIAQIAGEMGMTERAVEGKLYRVRKKLKDIISKKMEV